MSNTYTALDDDEDVFIQSDIQTPNLSARTPVAPGQSKSQSSQSRTQSQSQSQSQPQASNSAPLFNFSSFITPQFATPLTNIQTQERPFSGGNTLDESVLTTLHRDLSTVGDKLLSILWPLRLRQSLITVRRISNRFSLNSALDVEDAIDSTEANNTNGDSNRSEEYSTETLRKIMDWDLWGPLVINLGFSLIITYLQSRTLNIGSKNNDGSSQVFSASFTLIWVSLAVLSINIQLLSPVQQKLENGGLTNGVVGLSFFQIISFLSYSLFPIVLGGLISIFIKFKFIRLIINSVMLFWSLLCTWLILAIVNNCKKRGSLALTNNEDDNEGDKRIFLMIYPVFLVYGLLAWFCVIV